MYADPQSDPYAPLTEEQKEMAAGDKRVIIGTVIGTLGVVSVLFLLGCIYKRRKKNAWKKQHPAGHVAPPPTPIGGVPLHLWTQNSSREGGMDADVEKQSDYNHSSKENTLIGEDERQVMAVGERRMSWRHSVASTSSSRGVSPHTPIPYGKHFVTDMGVGSSTGLGSDIPQPITQETPVINAHDQKSATAEITRRSSDVFISSAQPTPTHRKRTSIRLVSSEDTTSGIIEVTTIAGQQNWVSH